MKKLVVRSAVVVATIATAATARADEPCAVEASAVAAAGKDASLAAPTEPTAVEHLEAGNRAFRVQQFDSAISEYTAAGLATSAPLVLYNLGQAFRASKQYDKAIRQYRLFLSRGNPGKALRAFVECVVDSMQGELDAAASTAPPTGPAPDGNAAAPNTGDDLGPAVDEQPWTAPPRSRWTGRRKLALVSAGVGALAAGAGIAFGIRSRGFESDAADLCPTDVCASGADADQANALVDKAESNALYANLAFGVGAVAVVGAVVLWVTGSPSAGVARGTALVPHVTEDGGGFTVRVPF